MAAMAMNRASTQLRLLSPPAPQGPAESAPAGAMDLEGLFRTYARYVASVALRVLGRDDEVDDVVQEVFLSAMRGLPGLRNADAVRGWLATIAVRHASRRLRRRRLRAFFGLDRDARYESVAPGASPEERALLSRIYAILDELPVAERVAWTLRHVEGEPLDVVARLCSCSLATAKRRIGAAHQAIERVLADA